MASSLQSVIAGIPSQNIAKGTGRPGAIGLYDPSNEKDACGVGFIVDLSSKQTRETVNNAITMLEVCVHHCACHLFPPLPLARFAHSVTHNAPAAPNSLVRARCHDDTARHDFAYRILSTTYRAAADGPPRGLWVREELWRRRWCASWNPPRVHATSDEGVGLCRDPGELRCVAPALPHIALFFRQVRPSAVSVLLLVLLTRNVCAPASRAPHLSHLTFAFPRCRCPRFYPPPRTRTARVSLNCRISRRKSSVIISLPCALSPRPPLTRSNCWHSIAVPCRNTAAA